MHFYDQVKAEMGKGPKYPTKCEYTRFYGYAGGAVIGVFSTGADAMEAGAVSTEATVDEEGFKAAQEAYRVHHTAISAEWDKRLRANYPEVSSEVFDICYAEADADGHSSGMINVEAILANKIDFATRILATRPTA